MESAKNILARIYREGREPKEQDEQIVRSFWAPTVGAQIASRTQPIRLYRGRLVVDVEGHDWRRQLAAMSREITAKLNAALGKTVLDSDGDVGRIGDRLIPDRAIGMDMDVSQYGGIDR